MISNHTRQYKVHGDGYSSALVIENILCLVVIMKIFHRQKVDGCILLGTYANDPSLLSLKKKVTNFV